MNARKDSDKYPLLELIKKKKTNTVSHSKTNYRKWQTFEKLRENSIVSLYIYIFTSAKVIKMNARKDSDKYPLLELIYIYIYIYIKSNHVI